MALLIIIMSPWWLDVSPDLAIAVQKSYPTLHELPRPRKLEPGYKAAVHVIRSMVEQMSRDSLPHHVSLLYFPLYTREKTTAIDESGDPEYGEIPHLATDDIDETMSTSIPTEKNLAYESVVTPSTMVEEGDDGDYYENGDYEN